MVVSEHCASKQVKAAATGNPSSQSRAPWWLSKLCAVLQTRVVPRFMSDERRGALNEWKNATMNSTGAISGVDYAKLNATLAHYFENATLVELAKTQAIVVIYKVHTHYPAYITSDAGKAVHNQRMTAHTGGLLVAITCI